MAGYTVCWNDGLPWLHNALPLDYLERMLRQLEELEKAFIETGFEMLPWRGLGYAESLSVRKDGFDVWDIHPANVLVTDSGLPLPFDVMITPVPSA